jgi:hypothetical protein|tara:strand:- start:2341 stop:2553 length:213 start_codon:yes stop_codon:yes gene_type:complete
MEFVLLTWLGMNLYYVDTYSNVNECISKAEILFKNEIKAEYMCVPNNHMNQTRGVKGLFDKSMLKSRQKK